MKEADRLAEMHILEAEARLRHIDEQMARARHASVNRPVEPSTELLVRRLRVVRDGPRST